MEPALKNPFDIKAPPKKEYNKIIPGSLIRVRGEEWKVIQKRRFIEDDPKSHFEVEAEGLTGIVVGYKSVFLSNIDHIELVLPDQITLRQDESKGFKKTKLYLESMLRNLPIRNDDKICVGHKGVFDTKAYQLQPALKALQQLRPRILIGDGVGLGKTIEIGILLSELIKRGKGRRILVVTPKAILTQFQKELFTRFGIALTRLDSTGIAKLNRMLPSTINPFMFHDRVIVSMDTLKNERYLSALERCTWDSVVIDECHNVSIKGGNSRNQRARLAQTLCENAEAVILSSATPHDGTMEGFASLIKLLDPTAIKDETNYQFEDISRLFIRRTKDSVKEELSYGKSRDNRLERFELSSPEEEVLHQLNNLKLDYDEVEQRKKRSRGRGFKELFKTTLIKAYLSSPDALIETIENKVKRSKDGNSGDLKKLEEIMSLAKKTTGKKFSKLKILRGLVDDLEAKKKVVIFTERIATLNLLEKELSEYGEVLKMDGSMGDSELMETASRFQSSKDKARILVATNVASEGLNLHHSCHHLVHFDLPWSFITLEQRNGRIDRIGQKHAPHLYYLCAESSNSELKADLHITDKLASRIEKAGLSMDDPSLKAGFITGEEEAEQLTLEFERNAFNADVEEEEKKEDDFLNQFFSGDNQEKTEAKKAFDESLKHLESFYDNDYDFTKESLELLEIESDFKKDEIIVPLDRSLRFELDTAPNEVTASDKIKLQFNDSKMNKEIENAIMNNEWPTSQWASDHHPLQEYLRTRCLDLFPGDEVPVVFYKGSANDHKMGFLVQGILYNKLGQIIFEEWAVCTYKSMFSKNAEPYGPYKISEIKDWTGLSKKNISNPRDKMTPRLEKTILERATISSEWMKDVMQELRNERGNTKRGALRKERERLQRWVEGRDKALNTQLSNVKKEKSVAGGFQKSEIQKELDRISKINQDYQSWVSDHYSTNKNPVIKIVGVFINAGKK